MLQKQIAVAFAIFALTASLRADDKELQLRRLRYQVPQQSLDGVTVRLEKITLQRLLGEPADEIQKTHTRSVTICVSISGAGKTHGPFKVVFANGYEPNKITLVGKSPPKWQPYVGLKVDPKAIGFERRQLIPNEFTIDDLFPATVTVTTTTKSGDKIELVFKNVRF